MQSIVDVDSDLIIHHDVANEANDSQLLHLGPPAGDDAPPHWDEYVLAIADTAPTVTPTSPAPTDDKVVPLRPPAPVFVDPDPYYCGGGGVHPALDRDKTNWPVW